MERENILLVEDEENWRSTLSRVLGEKAEVNVVASVQEAKEAVTKGGITRIISDGLEGKWEEVYKLAQEAGIPLKVFSANRGVQDRARKLGVPVVDKEAFSKDEVTVDEL